MNWMSAFLGRDHGWGQQRVATRLVQAGLAHQRTQAGGNVGGLPLSVAGMRPSKTGILYGQREAHAALTGMAAKRRSGWTRIAEEKISDRGDTAESETRIPCGLRRAMSCCGLQSVKTTRYERQGKSCRCPPIYAVL